MSNNFTGTTSREQEANRYSRRSILRSESIYGSGFNSSGGTEAIEFLSQDVPKFQGMSAIDIGSGLGGTSFYLAEKYGATVVGIDYAAEMVALSQERHKSKSHLAIAFEQGDIQTIPLEVNRFDLAWCRDVFVYIQDKEKGWSNIYGALKPGGYFVYVDFCKGSGSISQEFITYADTCNYHLLTLEQSSDLLQKLGFEVVKSKNISAWLTELYQTDLLRLEQNRNVFLQEFTEEEYQHLVRRWQGKIRYCQQEDLVQGLVIAIK